VRRRGTTAVIPAPADQIAMSSTQTEAMLTTRPSVGESCPMSHMGRRTPAPEIAVVRRVSAAWGEDVPKEGEGGDHAGHSMSGMMTAEEMTELQMASGKAFDTAFLEMVIKHHEGAVEMAKTEKADGSYQPAKDMADAIITSQSAEITRMNELLGKN
jgi:uncharacterized protein (DUF305 family)